MMNYFEEAKNRISMRDVLESYGISVNRGGMCFCPFHSEKTPSCKVYDESLHCFGCGEHQDIISFVKKYYNLDSQLDALKKLNNDFSLGLSLDKSTNPNKAEVSEFVKRKTEKELYRDWEKYAWETLRDKFRMLLDFKEKYAPKTPYENIDQRFIIACLGLDYSEYVLDEFMNTSFEDRKKFEEEVITAREFIEHWTTYHPEMPKFNRKREEINIDALMKRRCV